jgi:hypothetical protein
MDGNERVIARLRKLYQMYDKPDLVDAHVSHGEHAYRPDLRIAIFKWMNKHLKGDTGSVKDVDFKPIPGRELRVFPDDKDLPKDAINGKIDETFVPLPEVKLPVPGHFEQWKNELIGKLRENCFRAFPDPIPVAQVSGNDGLYRPMTEPAIHLQIDSFFVAPIEKTPNCFVETEQDRPLAKWREPWKQGSIHIYPRGTDLPWLAKSPPNFVARAHVLLGLTVDESRVRDIIATLKLFHSAWKEDAKCNLDPAKTRVIGRGRAGILAAYAALLEPSINEVVVIDPPVSHRDGPIFLNVLRVFDIPDALGMLAPRKLTLVNARDKAFDKTVKIYKLAGAEDKLIRK